jgi:hypothetical protein
MLLHNFHIVRAATFMLTEIEEQLEKEREEKKKKC